MLYFSTTHLFPHPLNELNSKSDQSLVYRGKIPSNLTSLDDFIITDSSKYKPGLYFANPYDVFGTGQQWYGLFILTYPLNTQIFISSTVALYIRTRSGIPAEWKKWVKFDGTSQNF